MRGCLFYFCQALWRNVALKGLTVLYRENNKAKLLLRCFGAMAFAHPNDVLEAFDVIVTALRTCVANGEIAAAFDDDIQRMLSPGHSMHDKLRFKVFVTTCATTTCVALIGMACSSRRALQTPRNGTATTELCKATIA